MHATTLDFNLFRSSVNKLSGKAGKAVNRNRSMRIYIGPSSDRDKELGHLPSGHRWPGNHLRGICLPLYLNPNLTLNPNYNNNYLLNNPTITRNSNIKS